MAQSIPVISLVYSSGLLLVPDINLSIFVIKHLYLILLKKTSSFGFICLNKLIRKNRGINTCLIRHRKGINPVRVYIYLFVFAFYVITVVNGKKKDGSTLLCLHGFPTSSYDWIKVHVI